jgi:fucose permease
MTHEAFVHQVEGAGYLIMTLILGHLISIFGLKASVVTGAQVWI